MAGLDDFLPAINCLDIVGNQKPCKLLRLGLMTDVGLRDGWQMQNISGVCAMGLPDMENSLCSNFFVAVCLS